MWVLCGVGQIEAHVPDGVLKKGSSRECRQCSAHLLRMTFVMKQNKPMIHCTIVFLYGCCSV